MTNKKFFNIVFGALVLIALAGCSLLPQPAATSDGLSASGTIQADTIRLAPELSGKIQEIQVKQGDEVQPGQIIFRLDDASLQTQRKQSAAALQAAQAAQAAAQANLDLLQAGPNADQLRAAQAQLDQASSGLNSAQAALWNAQANSRPEDINAAQTRLDLARQQYYHLTAALDAAQVDAAAAVQDQAESSLRQLQDRQARLVQDTRTPPDALEAANMAVSDTQSVLDYAKEASQLVQDNNQPLYLQIAAVRKTWNVAQLALSQARARQTALQGESDMLQEALNTAQTAVDDEQKMVDQAKKAYDSLNNSSQVGRLQAAFSEMQAAQRDFNSLGSSAGAANLEALTDQVASATAQQAAAQASYNNLKNGPRPEQISAARAQLQAAQAQVSAAQAALDNIDLQISKLAVSAPQGGIILNRAFDPGEIVPAGTTVVELGSLNEVTLKVYVPEDQYGKIKLGQAVTVHADSYPGRDFTGTVSSIANQAEFTPRNVQTQETRSTTVYGVEIRLPNADHALKPGMPADAKF